ncbi:hypothetical protein Hte_008877 [Hypoxylon texense]
MTFIKLSILSLYARIFPVPRFHWYLRAVTVFLVAWALQGVFVTIFQCTPIEYGWNRELAGGFCINYGINVLVSGIANIVTDFVILCIPIPLVLKLQATAQKKRLLIFIFALGGSACIVSIIRLPYSLRLGEFDGSWTGIPAAMINNAELMAGFLAASIPTYWPLYRRWVQGIKGSIRDRDKSKPYNHPRSGKDRGIKTFGVTNSGNEDTIYTNTLPRHVEIEGGEASNSGQRNPGGINVTEQIELVRHTKTNGAWMWVPDDDETRLCDTAPTTSHDE